MHDWTFLSFQGEWQKRCVTLVFLDPASSKQAVRVTGLHKLLIPQAFEWGPSASVNTCRVEQSNGLKWLQIEMQSGDTIEITAAEIVMPFTVNL